MDMNQRVKYTMTKVFSISPDGDAKKAGISKQLTAKVVFDNPLIDIVHKAGSGAIIQWQNGSNGRAKYDTYAHGQTITINFSAPSVAPQVDPETAFLNDAEAAGVDVDDQEALTNYIMDRMKKAN